MDFFTTLVFPIRWFASWVLVHVHDLSTSLGLAPESGLSWTIAIIGLVVAFRVLILPLTMKATIGMRGSSGAQPELKKIQDKYKGKRDPASRAKMQAEIQEVYREHGNPASSCLPMLIQMPIFISLFGVFRDLPFIAKGEKDGWGPLDQEQAQLFEDAEIFGAQLSDSFVRSDEMSVKIVALVLVILMMLTQWYSMRQMMTMNTPRSMADNPMMQSQRMMIWIFPIMIGVSGFAFPLGLVMYWFWSNLWTSVQQYIIMLHYPAPGSPAEDHANARRAQKGLPPLKYKTARQRRYEKAKKKAERRGEELPSDWDKPRFQITPPTPPGDSGDDAQDIPRIKPHEPPREIVEGRDGGQRSQPRRKKKKRRK